MVVMVTVMVKVLVMKMVSILMATVKDTRHATAMILFSIDGNKHNNSNHLVWSYITM